MVSFIINLLQNDDFVFPLVLTYFLCFWEQLKKQDEARKKIVECREEI